MFGENGAKKDKVLSRMYIVTFGSIIQPQIFVDIYHVSNTILAIEYKNVNRFIS